MTSQNRDEQTFRTQYMLQRFRSSIDIFALAIDVILRIMAHDVTNIHNNNPLNNSRGWI